MLDRARSWFASDSPTTVVSKERMEIVVVGDDRSGKTALVYFLANDVVPFDSLPATMSPVTPASDADSGAPFAIIDTGNSRSEEGIRDTAITRAHAIILCLACDDPNALHNATEFWLRHITNLRPDKVTPIVLTLTKADTASEDVTEGTNVPNISPDALASTVTQIRLAYEASVWVECAETSVQGAVSGWEEDARAISDAFRTALQCAMNPIAPLYNPRTKTLTARCESALRLIARLYDPDHSQILSNDALRQFQSDCFEISLTEEDLDLLKQTVREMCGPNALSSANEVTEDGFLGLNRHFIGDPETREINVVWQALRHFGFDDHLALRLPSCAILPHSSSPTLPLALPFDFGAPPAVELSDAADTLLIRILKPFAVSTETSHALSVVEWERMLQVVPHPPEYLARPQSVTAYGADPTIIPLSAVVAATHLSMMVKPQDTLRALATLAYAYGCDLPGEGEQPLYRTALKRKARRVFRVVVAGPKGSGKSSLISVLCPSVEGLGPAVAITEASLGPSTPSLLLAVSENSPVPPQAKPDCVLITFNSTLEQSLNDAIELQCALSQKYPDTAFHFVGTHADIDAEESLELTDRCREYCEKNLLTEPALVVATSGNVGGLWTRCLRMCLNPESSCPNPRSQRLRRGLALGGLAAAVLALGVMALRRHRVSTGQRDSPPPPPEPAPTQPTDFLDSLTEGFKGLFA